mmetsp:Transcript_9860/g.36099  ORF Transcript_9860/g.36099 Transcript_9860/m.36099 type:complete len:298 (+) Transcript_9860:221-1114(+)
MAWPACRSVSPRRGEAGAGTSAGEAAEPCGQPGAVVLLHGRPLHLLRHGRGADTERRTQLLAAHLVLPAAQQAHQLRAALGAPHHHGGVSLPHPRTVVLLKVSAAQPAHELLPPHPQGLAQRARADIVATLAQRRHDAEAIRVQLRRRRRCRHRLRSRHRRRRGLAVACRLPGRVVVRHVGLAHLRVQRALVHAQRRCQLPGTKTVGGIGEHLHQLRPSLLAPRWRQCRGSRSRCLRLRLPFCHRIQSSGRVHGPALAPGGEVVLHVGPSHRLFHRRLLNAQQLRQLRGAHVVAGAG